MLGEVLRLGVKSELELPAYTTAHGNARPLTHGAGPGIETTSSWILVRFVTTEAQRELLYRAYFILFYFILFFGFLGPHLRHMEVPRLGVESELQLPAYTTATATPDPSHVCDLHNSSRQC